MNKLISAGFTRLWKDKIFWLIFIFMFMFGALVSVKTGVNAPLEGIFFAFAVTISIPTAVFCGMFVGTEYSDGTIRNKIIVGHSRCAVYFSNLIVNIVACILIAFSYTLAVFIVGVPRLGFFQVSAEHILFYSFVSIMMIFALTSIYTLLCLLITNKATSAVICVLVSFALFFSSITIKSRLEEIKYYESNATSNAIEQLDTKRDLYQFLYDFVPTCQGMQIAMQMSDEPWLLPVYSSVIIIITSGLGIFLFRRKDLK
ncbi:MAG TPA: ABC transporter permease [Clostridiales bacterium]|nr:ABC transporter permease [Clostridiales bacterium]